MRKRPPAHWALGLGLAAALLASSCAAPQPEECAVYVGCFFPAEGGSPYATTGREGLVEHKDLALQLYGPDGECWRNGVDDPLYEDCRQACEGALVAECDLQAPACLHESEGDRAIEGGGELFSCPSDQGS